MLASPYYFETEQLNLCGPMDHAPTLHGINHAPNFFSFLFFSEHPPYKANVVVLMVCKVPFAELRGSG